jgi:hypothetical protein
VTRPFRLEEDERRYFALRSEFYVRLVQSGARPQTVHDIMRNFGKLEDMMFFEGVRQGMVAALLMPRRHPDTVQRPAPALTTHHTCYEDAATPLARVEREHIDAIGVETALDHPWLSDDPVEFGPLTIAEAAKVYGADEVVVAPPPVVSPVAPTAQSDDGHPDTVLSRLAAGEDPDKVFADISVPDEPLLDLAEVVDGDGAETEPLHRPELLDRVRDVLTRLQTAPTSWQDLMLLLMRDLHMDAGYLDAVMSTPMGMTVISQANLFHLHPGSHPEVRPAEPPVR